MSCTSCSLSSSSMIICSKSGFSSVLCWASNTSLVKSDAVFRRWWTWVALKEQPISSLIDNDVDVLGEATQELCSITLELNDLDNDEEEVAVKREPWFGKYSPGWGKSTGLKNTCSKTLVIYATFFHLPGKPLWFFRNFARRFWNQT